MSEAVRHLFWNDSLNKMIHVFSSGISKIQNLEIFLQDEIKKYGELTFHGAWESPKAQSGDLVIGWGHKKTAEKARVFAHKHALPYLALEDGFLRSLRLGVEGEQPLSLSFDRTGAYYDAGSASDLEAMLNNTGWCTGTVLEEACAAIARFKFYDLSKYNNAPSFTSADKVKLYNKAGVKPGQKLILVVDQTEGDAGIALGNANAQSFQAMLSAALAVPDAVVVVKTHPDVLSGKKRSCFGTLPPNVYVMSESFAPLSFVEAFDEVYVATSQMGFEALLMGKVVHTFGAPFYAGWGLTIDHGDIPGRRKGRPTLEQMFAAAYLKLCRYVNPVTKSRIALAEAIDIMAARRQANEENRRDYVAVGFRRWKWPHVKAFASSTGGTIQFEGEVEYGIDLAAQEGKTVLIWAGKATDAVVARCRRRHVPLIRMEDGFLRSVGLGVDYHYPFSLVMDDCGIYFDPARPSRLTHILQNIQKHPDLPRLLERSDKLIQLIVENGLSKYNTPSDPAVVEQLQALPRDRTIVLVPGQVDGDASVRRGGGMIQSNEKLLQAVRRANPSAFIIFKPHPDVVTGNREGTISEETVKTCTDLIVMSGSLNDFWPYVDEVHTLTSLSGFEALLRNKKVVTYGMPFYAGWGLTTDFAAEKRVDTALTLREFVSCIIILYPKYWDWATAAVCCPEDVCYRILRHEQPEVGLWIMICRLAKVVRRKFARA